MKRKILALALAGLATGAPAAEIAPGDVVFEDGAVAVSLTGQPGDPVRGREIVGSKSLGNCVACHANSEMADVPFQGEIGPAQRQLHGRHELRVRPGLGAPEIWQKTPWCY